MEGEMSMNNLFTIDCGEILLREFRIEDVDAIYELTSQPEVYEFLPDWRSTRDQRVDWVTNYDIPDNKEFLANVPSIGEGCLKLGIVLKETDEFIGFCNTGIKEELSGPNREVAYSISKHYRNKGYTTQAVKGLVNYLFANTDVEQLNAVVLPRNIASNKVIAKCGFHLKGNVEIEDQLHYHYTLEKKELME
jgi:[ribosomal protein S5]-alanine N-acetyltransferase